MFLHGARSQHQRLRGGRIGFALGHAGQHLALARGEISQWRVRNPCALPEQCLDHLWVDNRATLRDLSDSRDHLIGVGNALLQ